MKILAKEKAQVLAETHQWSLRFAEGYLNGEMHRRRGKRPNSVELIGRDEYCLGFRTGCSPPRTGHSRPTPWLGGRHGSPEHALRRGARARLKAR